MTVPSRVSAERVEEAVEALAAGPLRTVLGPTEGGRALARECIEAALPCLLQPQCECMDCRRHRAALSSGVAPNKINETRGPFLLTGQEEGEAVTVPLDDRTMDRILDDLTERAGLERGTDALGLARWNLQAALRKAALSPEPGGER